VDEDLLARLAGNPTIGAAPTEELAWILAHSRKRTIDPGGNLAPAGQPIEHMWIVLSGSMAVYVDRGLGARRVTDWHGGVLGLVPYSRMTIASGTIVVTERSEFLEMDGAHLPALIRECPVVTTALVHEMVDRSRAFTSSDLHDEKMVSLGRVAAGLAHELNNPASAAARSAERLNETLVDAEAAAGALAGLQLTEAQLQAINRAREASTSGDRPVLTPVARADREDELATWLEDHGADAQAAETLVDSTITIDELDELAAALAGDGLDAAVRWMAVCCTVKALAADIERAVVRVHDLVSAVKRFSYMDRQQVPESIDVLQGVRDSVAIVAHKARKKSVAIEVEGGRDVPPVHAIGSDLNQVWTNLVDNAIDAVPEHGHVTITAARELDVVVVRVVDDGPGIAAENVARIFDPFFTTKPVGQGTGLGLEIAQRLVRRNGGDISVESRPGRTEFRVTVPVAPGGASRPGAATT
jgi:signal transduction histidine kinase